MTHRDASETEAKLILPGPGARAAADEVASRKELPGFVLASAGALVLHDRYFDTARAEREAGRLTRAQRVFRVRELQEGEVRQVLLTIKGTRAEGVGHALRRLEIERSWPSEEAGEVFEALEQAGVRFPRVGGRWLVDREVSIVATLQGIGLVVTQDRTTQRRRRIAARATAPEAPVAEIAIDRVTYLFADRYVYHHEVEVEQLEGGSVADLDALVEALRAHHPRLMPFTTSKLEIGFELAALAEAGSLDEHLIDAEVDERGYATLAARRAASPSGGGIP